MLLQVKEDISYSSSKSDVSMATETVQGVLLKANILLTSFHKEGKEAPFILQGKNRGGGCWAHHDKQAYIWL